MVEDPLKRFKAVLALQPAHGDATVRLKEPVEQHADGYGELVAHFAIKCPVLWRRAARPGHSRGEAKRQPPFLHCTPRSANRPACGRRQPYGRHHRTARVWTRNSSTIPSYGWFGTEARISLALACTRINRRRPSRGMVRAIWRARPVAVFAIGRRHSSGRLQECRECADAPPTKSATLIERPRLSQSWGARFHLLLSLTGNPLHCSLEI